MSGDVNPEVLTTYSNMWTDATKYYNLAEGKTLSISSKEFEDISLFLDGVANNTEYDEDTKKWAKQQLSDLQTMRTSKTNQQNLQDEYTDARRVDEKSKELSWWEKLRKKMGQPVRQSYATAHNYKNNAISQKTLDTYRTEGIDGVRKLDQET